jgi:hypothetical protein
MGRMLHSYVDMMHGTLGGWHAKPWPDAYIALAIYPVEPGGSIMAVRRGIAYIAIHKSLFNQ